MCGRCGIPGLSRLIEKSISELSPIQRIMKMAEVRNIRDLGLDPDEVISFGGGWCNHTAPDRLREIYAGICGDTEDFHRSGRYSPIMGELRLREQLCAFEGAVFGMRGQTPDNIIVGQSSTQLFYDVMKVLCDPGHDIAVLDPTYANYLNAVKCALPGSRLRFLPALDHGTWEYLPDPARTVEALKEACGENNVRALVIPNPDNPTSRVVPDDLLRAFREILEDHGGYLVMDHAYKTLCFGEMPGSFSWSPAEYPNLISILSNSKWISSLGRRLGWVEAPEEVIGGMEKVAEVSLLSPDTLHSIATARFLEETLSDGTLFSYMEEVRGLYRETAKITVEAIDAHLGMPRLEPEGGLYTCVKVGCDPVRFAEEVLENTGVLFIPGKGFGPSMDEGIRVSYGPLCYDHELIRTGMGKVGEYLEGIGGEMEE